jgi:hypothetical protein
VTLRIEYLPLEEIPDDERNAKGHRLAEIDQSMDRHGFVEPVVIDERTGKLLSGHGRKGSLIARRDAGGAPPVHVEIAEDGSWTLPVVRGVRTPNDAEAAALIVGVNELVIAGGWDPRRLAAMLEEARATPRSLEGTGYTGARLDEMLAELAGPDSPDAFPIVDPDALDTPHQCPSCGYRWSGSTAATAEVVE